MAGVLLTHRANTDNTSSLLWKWISGSVFSFNKKDFPSGQVSVGVLSVEMENGDIFLDCGDLFSVVNHVSKTPRQAFEWFSGSGSPDGFKPVYLCEINQLGKSVSQARGAFHSLSRVSPILLGHGGLERHPRHTG